MLNSECRAGMAVTVNAPHDLNYHGKTGRIMKVNPVNVKIQLEATGRTLTIPPGYLTTDTVPPYGATVTSFAYVPAPPAGTIVRVRNSTKVHGLHVVIGAGRAGERTRIAKLGGDDHRYWTVPTRDIVIVSLVDLAHELRTLVKVNA